MAVRSSWNTAAPRSRTTMLYSLELNSEASLVTTSPPGMVSCSAGTTFSFSAAR